MAPDPGLTVRVSRVHFPVRVLGPGRRLGIWLQGCGIGCPGCVSRDTWNPDGGTALTVGDLLARCEELVEGRLDGVTISGGEPFEQPEALADLVDGLRAWGARRGEVLDILCYSGRTESALRRNFRTLVDRMDVIVAGPYVAARGLEHPLAGSANQRVLAISELGRARLAWLDPLERPRMQMDVSEERIWMIGIPRAGDLARIEAELASRGVDLEEVSWR